MCSGALALRSHMELHLEMGAVLKGSDRLSDYRLFGGDAPGKMAVPSYENCEYDEHIPAAHHVDGPEGAGGQRDLPDGQPGDVLQEQQGGTGVEGPLDVPFRGLAVENRLVAVDPPQERNIVVAICRRPC